MSKPYDLAIAMTTYFDPYGRVPAGYRRPLYDNLIRSLQNVDWCGKKTILVLRDDHSSEPPEPPLIQGIDLSYKCQPTHIGMNDNLWDCLYDAQYEAEWILWLDSDMLVKPDIIKRLFELVDKFPEALAYGSFNTKYHPTKIVFDAYVLKSSLTESGTLFRSKDLSQYPSPLMENLKSTQQATKATPIEVILYPCLRPSAAQHCGKLGFNNEAGDDFDGEWL